MWLGLDGATLGRAGPIFLCTCSAADMRSAESSSIGESTAGEEPSRTIAAHTCAHRHPDSGWLHGVELAYLVFGSFRVRIRIRNDSVVIQQPARHRGGARPHDRSAHLRGIPCGCLVCFRPEVRDKVRKVEAKRHLQQGASQLTRTPGSISVETRTFNAGPRS